MWRIDPGTPRTLQPPPASQLRGHVRTHDRSPIRLPGGRRPRRGKAPAGMQRRRAMRAYAAPQTIDAGSCKTDTYASKKHLSSVGICLYNTGQHRRRSVLRNRQLRPFLPWADRGGLGIRGIVRDTAGDRRGECQNHQNAKQSGFGGMRSIWQ